MKKEDYISLDLAKWLYDNGCKIESNLLYLNGEYRHPRQDDLHDMIHVYSYYDILVTNSEEFFKEALRWDGHKFIAIATADKWCYENIVENVFQRLRANRIKDAEWYIKKYCIFNPKNKYHDKKRNTSIERSQG